MHRPPRNAAPAGSAGFTLTEILIVLAIVGLAALIAFPSASPNGQAKLELAAEGVAEAMRFARSEAIRTGISHGFRIDPTNHQLLVFELDTGSAPPAELYNVYHPVSKKPYVLDLTIGLTRGVTIGARSFVFQPACAVTESIAFDERGSPICPNPVASRLLDGKLIVRYEALQRTVQVAPLTGRVTQP